MRLNEFHKCDGASQIGVEGGRRAGTSSGYWWTVWTGGTPWTSSASRRDIFKFAACNEYIHSQIFRVHTVHIPFQTSTSWRLPRTTISLTRLRSNTSAPPVPDELSAPVLQCLEILLEATLALSWGHRDGRLYDTRELHRLVGLVLRVEVNTLARIVIVDAHDVDIGSRCRAQPDT